MNELHLVTGGAGCFGSRLVERLHGIGVRVRIFDINASEQRAANVETCRGDIRDAAAVRRALEGVAVVYHNVAMCPRPNDRRGFFAVNRDGTRNVLDGALGAEVRKTVYMSTSAVFGASARNPVDDATQPHPEDGYGLAKLAAEELCADYIARGLDVTVLRPPMIIGLGRPGLTQILFEWVRQGRNIPVLGRGDNVHQFVHADDLADAAIAAASRPGSATYNVGADRFGTIRETLEGLARHARTGSKVVSVPTALAVAVMKASSRAGLSPLAAYHSLICGRSTYFDLARTKRELDWTPKYGNVEMLCDSFDWYMRHRDEFLARHGPSHHRSPVRQGVLRAVSWALSFAAVG